jgi:hypothetical protein
MGLGAGHGKGRRASHTVVRGPISVLYVIDDVRFCLLAGRGIADKLRRQEDRNLPPGSPPSGPRVMQPRLGSKDIYPSQHLTCSA